ncbi:hypothetical protein Tco_1009388 [Tanacetum coccineum]
MTTLVEKGKLANSVSKKAVTFNQRIEAKQWKGPGKGSKKGGNLRKGQAAGNIYSITMAEDSQTKDYPNFLSGVSDLFSALRGGGWDEGSHDN